MSFGNAVICILFSTLAVSYGWGMRGSLIGGEKGAMLPGALIGLILGWFSGPGYLGAAAAGLMGMTFGGTETYGETIGFVLHGDNPKKGYEGLALKGGLWFSLCGGFIGISLSYGVYSESDIYVFCLLIPLMQIIGSRVFNTPIDPKNNKFPKFYFSKTRREEWGGNVFTIIAMAIMSALKNDYLTLILMAGGFVFGAIGWLVAMRAYVMAVNPLKNGKYLFGKLYHKGLIDGWKLMEFILGAFGGFGLSLAFCLGYDFVEAYKEKASVEGVEFANEYVSEWIPVFCIVCLIGIISANLISFICDKKGKKLNSLWVDRVERVYYNVIPMMFVLNGAYYPALFMTAFMLIFVIVNKLVFDRFEKVNFVSILIFAAVTVSAYILCVENSVSAFGIVLAGTLPYLAGEAVWIMSKQGRNGKTVKEALTKTSLATVYPCFAVMSIILIAASYKIFRF